MEALEKKYKSGLDELKETIQKSESLATYLESEEEEDYKTFQQEFEPQIADIYNYIAEKNPLQLESLEDELLSDEFEGLFLPKILGYSVLRGDVDANLKYRKPQDHFKNILLAIANSANYELIKNRIGQTVQIGFALSSDIWITNLLDSIENKKIRLFLSSMKAEKFREFAKRKEAYTSYKKQFSQQNFQSTDFPTNDVQLASSFHSIRTFLLYRAEHVLDNESLNKHILNFISSDAFTPTDEYLEIFIILGLMFPLDNEEQEAYRVRFAKINETTPDFQQEFFTVYDGLYNDKNISITPNHEVHLCTLIRAANNKDINDYADTVGEMHSKGFVHPDAIDKIRRYYEMHDGMSVQNECLRASVLGYMDKLLNHFEPENFTDYTEMNKIITAYMGIFYNEEFNQVIKNASLNYVAKCLKVFTDKRGKDYQDLKKYVATTYKDLGFLTEKEVVELFKTKRKKTD